MPVYNFGLIEKTGRRGDDFVFAFGGCFCHEASCARPFAIAFLGSTFHLNISRELKVIAHPFLRSIEMKELIH